MPWELTIKIGVAAGIGACSRMLVTEWVAKRDFDQKTHWPTATFIINIFGAFLFACMAKHALNLPLQRMIMIGFLGGFTTFSTFNNEVIMLWRAGRFRLGVIYASMTYLGGILAVWLGLAS